MYNTIRYHTNPFNNDIQNNKKNSCVIFLGPSKKN